MNTPKTKVACTMQRRREEKGKEDGKSPKSGKGGEERNEETTFSPLMTRAIPRVIHGEEYIPAS